MTLDQAESQLKHWVEHDPDPITRAELVGLLNESNSSEIEELFKSRIQFGTAGLRGALGPGPNRMNQLTMRRLAIGLAQYLGTKKKVVIGRDARHKSDDFFEDLAAIMTGNNIDVFVFPKPIPTPLLAFAVRYLQVDMGIMITASHNPSSDNGCKVYLNDGAQLRAPIDEEIDKLVSESEFPHIELPLGNGKRFEIDEGVEDAYCKAITSSVTQQNSKILIAYTPLHGVAMKLVSKVFNQTKAGKLLTVESQKDPDPEFPTVHFPNPEEQGVMDAVIDLDKSSNADLALANDPDGDRLAVAIPTTTGSWRTLTGDEIGALLFSHITKKSEGDNRKVVTTVVCSDLVPKIAASHNIHHKSTLTGFKWIIPTAYEDTALEPIFCYEEALGYATNTAVRDKDGISAALIMAELTAVLKEQGRSLEDQLVDLSLTYGHHVTETKRIRFESNQPKKIISKIMEDFRDKSVTAVNEMNVLKIEDYLLQKPETGLPNSDLMVLHLENDVRVSIRPSGTEPMIKLYMEKVVTILNRRDLSSESQKGKRVLEETGIWIENFFKELV